VLNLSTHQRVWACRPCRPRPVGNFATKSRFHRVSGSYSFSLRLIPPTGCTSTEHTLTLLMLISGPPKSHNHSEFVAHSFLSQFSASSEKCRLCGRLGFQAIDTSPATHIMRAAGIFGVCTYPPSQMPIFTLTPMIHLQWDKSHPYCFRVTILSVRRSSATKSFYLGLVCTVSLFKGAFEVYWMDYGPEGANLLPN